MRSWCPHGWSREARNPWTGTDLLDARQGVSGHSGRLMERGQDLLPYPITVEALGTVPRSTAQSGPLRTVDSGSTRHRLPGYLT